MPEHFTGPEHVDGSGGDAPRSKPHLAELEARHRAEQERRASIAAKEVVLPGESGGTVSLLASGCLECDRCFVSKC